MKKNPKDSIKNCYNYGWVCGSCLQYYLLRRQRSQFKAIQDKIAHKTPSQPIKAGCSGVHLSSQYAGSINRRIVIQAGLGINTRPYSKNN
jgi:hypothetical protein